MQLYFDGTRVGGAYGVTNGSLPLNYMQIYAADVLYASTNNSGSLVVDGFGNNNTVTAQSELNNASSQISEIAELDLNLQVVGQTLQLSWLAAPTAVQLQVNHQLLNPNGWTPALQKQTLTNGFYNISITPTSSPAFFRLASP